MISAENADSRVSESALQPVPCVIDTGDARRSPCKIEVSDDAILKSVLQRIGKIEKCIAVLVCLLLGRTICLVKLCRVTAVCVDKRDRTRDSTAVTLDRQVLSSNAGFRCNIV